MRTWSRQESSDVSLYIMFACKIVLVVLATLARCELLVAAAVSGTATTMPLPL